VGREAMLGFLTALARNNTKAWFEAHRNDYKEARAAFEALVAEVIVGLGEIDELDGVTPSDCIFRINRDVRFSHNKSPYHSALRAAIGRGGRRGEGRTYFVQLAPNDSFVGSGLFEPDKATLDTVRQHLARDAEPLRALIGAPSFAAHFGALQGETLKTAPQGYARDHPAIDLLRYKQLLAVQRFTDGEVCENGLGGRIVEACIAMQPFLNYLDTLSSKPPAL
jgi:uncharacterized protein (TIGR02453 family)